MSEIEASEVQADAQADVIDPIKVIYEGECPSISGRSTLAFAVGRHADEKTMHLAITGNSGKGMWCKDWAPASAIQEVALGITGIKSYFKKLLLPIAICVLLSAVIGACVSGFLGLIFGAIAGIMVPAALIWLAPIVGYVAVSLACVAAALAVLFYGAIWLFSW